MSPRYWCHSFVEIPCESVLRFGNKVFLRHRRAATGKVIEAKLLQSAAARAPARPKQKRGPVPMTHPWRFFDFTENSMLAKERRGELCILRKWVTSLF